MKMASNLILKLKFAAALTFIVCILLFYILIYTSDGGLNGKTIAIGRV